jgi:uncharacterized Zn finger protein
MTEAAERVGAICPSCSPDAETVHEVLKPGGQATVRCTDCGHVHKTTIEEPETVTRDVIVSQDGESFSATVETEADERVEVGEEFVLDTEEAILVVRITSLELPENRRVEEALARDVETFWTRAVDNVGVNVTLHPKDGRADETRSFKLQLPGDEEFTVGETVEYGDEEFTVEGIHVRADVADYEFSKFDHEGDRVPAKDVKRVYARDESSTAWSAW